MRIVGQLKEEASAQKFSEFLWSKEIHNEVDADGDGNWSIWVHDEDQMDAAKEEFDRFNQDPDGQDYASIARRAQKVRKDLQEKERQAKAIKGRKDLFVDVRPYGIGPLTWSLIAVCVVVTFLTEFGGNTERANPLFITEVKVNGGFVHWMKGLPEIKSGQVWRPITPIFLHMSPIHLFFNMWWLFSFSAMIEARKGPTLLMSLIIISAATSNLLQYAFVSPLFGGFSGVNYALFGYLWMKGRYSRHEGMGVNQQSVVILMAWFFLCLFNIIPHVANWCHGGGLVVGLLWGVITSRGAWKEILGMR